MEHDDYISEGYALNEIEESRMTYRQEDTDELVKEATARYKKAAAAKLGDIIKCACCSNTLTKKHYQQKFCPGKKGKASKCKDIYWNTVDTKRRMRAAYRGRR